MNLKKMSMLVLSIMMSTGSGLCTTGSNSNIENDNNKNNKFKTMFVKVGPKIGIGASIGVASLVVGRYLANKFIFIGTEKLSIPKVDKSTENYTYKYITIDGLSGCSLKLNNPKNHSLDNKCVLVFGPNAGSSAAMVYDKKYGGNIHPLSKLLNNGATLIGIDYRGYGNSEDISRLRISETTLYKDGEKIYSHVIGNLGYKPEDVILFAHSLGGAVASHVLSYASRRGNDLGGLILASPINNLLSAASAFTFKPLGFLARALSMSDLNTEKNLSQLNDKNVPIFLCSGDSCDVLSLTKTKLGEKIKKLGFSDVTENISYQCDHNDLERMFDGKDGSDAPGDISLNDDATTLFEKYILNIGNKPKN